MARTQRLAFNLQIVHEGVRSASTSRTVLLLLNDRGIVVSQQVIGGVHLDVETVNSIVTKGCAGTFPQLPF